MNHKLFYILPQTIDLSWQWVTLLSSNVTLLISCTGLSGSVNSFDFTVTSIISLFPPLIIRLINYYKPWNVIRYALIVNQSTVDQKYDWVTLTLRLVYRGQRLFSTDRWPTVVRSNGRCNPQKHSPITVNEATVNTVKARESFILPPWMHHTTRAHFVVPVRGRWTARGRRRVVRPPAAGAGGSSVLGASHLTHSTCRGC